MAFKHWRLNWLSDQIMRHGTGKRHRDVLKTPLKYWFALFSKVIPGTSGMRIDLTLKEGGRFIVRDFMTLYIYNEIFVNGGYDNPRLEAEAPVIIDIGANTGLFTLRMKQLYPDASLYCYEPFEKNFRDLQDNVVASSLDKVRLFSCAVGGIDRKEKLYLNKGNIGGHSFYKSEAQSDDFVETEVISLKTIFGQNQLEAVHLLKLDCEGAEHEILMSLDGSLARKVQHILFESTDSVYNVNEVIKHLDSFGFDVAGIDKTCNFLATNRNFTV